MLMPNYINEVLKAYFEVSSQDRKTLLDEAWFDFNPATCKKEYLPLLAKELGVDISFLSESDARVVIQKALESFLYKGTVRSLKSALKAFSEVEIKEWFETKEQPYSFKAEITPTNLDFIFSKDKLIVLKKLINSAKNVRSHLNSFEIRLPPINVPLKVGTFSEALKIHPFMNIDEIIDLEKINITGGYKYDLEIKTNINESITADNIKLTGGYTWQVEV